jgi:hypothetical protein
MEHLNKIRKHLSEELKPYGEKGKISMGDLETLYKLTETIKNLYKIEMYEKYDDEEGGYSREGDGYSRARYIRDGDGRSYNDGGNSYANRGEHYVRGHYSRDDGHGESRYSMADGKGNMTDRLREMMDDARNDKEREAIRRCLSQIENM